MADVCGVWADLKYARRVDTNHAEIVKALRKIGASVWDTSRVGHGWPDLVVGWRGRNIFIECKWLRPTHEGGRHKETKGQLESKSAWRGDAWIVVTSPEDAIEQLINAVVLEVVK